MGFFSILVPRFDDLPQKLAWKMACYLSTGIGAAGSDLITGPAIINGDFWCIHALGGDCVFGGITFRAGTSTGNYAGKILSNGDREYGNIISVNLLSGTLVCYRASAGSP